jgi:hypothetical protein
MICSLSKWFISRSFDLHRENPGFVQRHLRQCAVCQDFARFSQELAERSVQDACVIIQETPGSFLKKVKQEPSFSLESKSRPWLQRRLVLVVSTALATFLVLILILFRPIQVFSPDSDNGVLQIIRASSLSGPSLQKLAVQVESPYDKEWISLKNTIISAADHLTSYLDLKIDQTQR